MTASQLLQVLGPCSESGSKQHGQTVLSKSSPLDEITGGVALADIDRNDYGRYVEAGRMVAKTAGLAPGTSGLLVNGRVKFHPLICPLPLPDCVFQVVGPIASGEFIAEDYETLQDYELAKRVQPVLSALEDIIPALTGYDR